MTIQLLVEGVVSKMIDEALADLDVPELVEEAVFDKVDIDDAMAEKVKEMIDNANMDSIIEESVNNSGLEDQIAEMVNEKVKEITDRLVEGLDVADLIEAAVQRKLEVVLNKT